MDSSDSLKIDENLARFLAAFDQGIEGGDPDAPTVHAPMPEGVAPPASERAVTPLRGTTENEGSLGEVLPDPGRPVRSQFPLVDFTPPPGAPHRVGRFELRRQLGKGGCGIVFLAYDPKLQREVALKIPRPEMLMNPDAKRRLIREAQAAAEFDHPNLVPVFETGELGPVCYIATAFCPGQTLAEWLDRQAFPVPVRQAARLVATVAEAVQHAHDRGVLHRDLKPNNVILQELKVEQNDEPPPGSVQLRGEHYLPRLVDFGLAKLAERGGPSETATRQILGTPKYMAPEQAQARREDIGPPADVYALGVILYEMIAGRAPYDGASDVEVLRQSVEGKPVPPRDLRPDIPRDLEAICLKAMARTTSDRYRTAIDFADDLRRFLDGLPTIARPLSWSGRAVRWFRRNDQLVAIGVLALVVLFLTALGGWTTYLSRQHRKDLDNALSDQASRNRTEQEREYARQMRDAFFAWRSGNAKASSDALDKAKRASAALMEQPDFAHSYLARLVKAEQLTIVTPAGSVTALAVSPDGARLASGHADGTLAVWDRATGKQLGTVRAHSSDVTHVAFALGGTLLVTCGKSADNSSNMFGWSVTKDGAVVRAPDALHALGKDVYCFAVSHDGKTVFAGGHNGVLMKRTLGDAAPVIAPASAPGQPPVTAIAVSHDGKRVITAGGGTVLSWTPGLKRDDLSEYEFRSEVTALAVSFGMPTIGLSDGTVWAVQPACVPLIYPTGGRVHWMATARDGLWAHNGKPGRVDLGGGCDLATGDTGDVRAGAFAPDGKTLFTGSEDGTIRAWDVARDARERGATRSDAITALSVIDGGAFAYTTPHHVARTDLSNLESSRGVVAVRVLDDGGTRVVSFDGRSVVVRDLTGNTGTERFRAPIPDDRTGASAALTADGKTVAVGDDAGRVTLWSVADKTALGTVDTGLRRPVRRVALAEDGRRVAVPSKTGVSVWAVGMAEPLGNIEVDEPSAFCLLPAVDRIATAGRDGVVRVWTFAGKEELALFGHVGRVTGLGCSPDGRTLVSGGATGDVKMWDMRTGQELLGLRRHSTPVTLIEFSPSGKVLVTAGDGQYAVWDARSE